jgi:predicted alpha/beta superfamily hydrolase
MREVIQVAVDNVEADECSWAATRLRDYAPPGETFVLNPPCTGTGTGQADRFAAFLRDELKPWIDAQYRTLPDREHTAFAGWSAGGLAAFYLGWDFPDSFGRVGAQSFSNPLGTAFVARVHVESKRSIRVYLDAGGGVGDYGTYQRSLALRDDLLTKAPEPYVLERDLRHFVGALDQSHTAPAAGSRWTEMLPFLFPATEEPPVCYDGIDNDGDGAIDYAPGAGGDDGCASALDPSEGRNDCSDGIDNDSDGHADSDDPGCPSDFAWPENPQCDDEVDNDANGLVDLDDPKCQNPHWPYWEKPPACGLGAELAVLLPAISFLRWRRRAPLPRSRT